MEFTYEEQEAIKAVMLEYINNCQHIVLDPKQPHGFYTVRRNDWEEFIPRFEELCKQYNITEDRLIDAIESDFCTPMIRDFIEQGQIEPFKDISMIEDEPGYDKME